MSFEAGLDALARSYGIEPFYWDIQGVQHFASTNTKIKLLATMGVQITDEASLVRAQNDFALRQWEQVCPPVAILAAGQGQLWLDIRLPQENANAELRWRVERSGFGGAILLAPVHVEEVFSTANGRHFQRKKISFDLSLASGYYTLRMSIGETEHNTLILASPARCYFPSLQEPVFGISGQLYSLMSKRNFGLGDLGDLFEAKDSIAQSGAQFVGLNPLHALFEGSTESISPYSPSSRLAWNSLIIAEERIAENGNAKVPRRTANDNGLLNYEAAWADRLSYWKASYELYLTDHAGKNTEREQAFRRYLEQVNSGTKEYALYSALREYLLEQDKAYWGWPAWPKHFQDPESPSVLAFAREYKTQVDFYLYLQFLADSQLAELTSELQAAGVSLALYLDLALGANSGGAETWYRQQLYAFSASMGAPPDELGPLGQVWGLPPIVPHRMRESQFALFREALAHVMSRAEAVRIDHIMSLCRLFWVPEGGTAKDGGYVRYPFDELLAIVCIESERNKCLVVGEDLGTVPDEVRDGMRRTGILSYKVLYFMHHDRKFLPAESYPQESLVVTSTHDLPTLKSFWSGIDIELRLKLKLFAEEKLYPFSKELREKDREGLLERLRQENLWGQEDKLPDALSEEAIIAFHRFLARAPSVLQAIQLEDLALLTEQANLPGTVDEHPNWRRKLPASLKDILESPFAKRLLAAVRAERGR